MVEAEFPYVELIRNQENLGFGRANNLGLDALKTDLALLLNSDAKLLPDSLGLMLEAFDDPSVVAVGPTLRFPDGGFQPSVCRRLSLWAVFCEQTFLEKLIGSYWLPPISMDKEHVEVEQVMGACLMLRPMERFDERFFLYCEDTDLCRRLKRHGRILYLRRAEVIHALGASSRRDRWRTVAQYNRGKELYFLIHHGRAAMAVCWMLNRFGALLRLVIWSIMNAISFALNEDWRSKPALFSRVLLAPLAGPPRPPDTAQ
jgi:GT2 family glycosyltransferase